MFGSLLKLACGPLATAVTVVELAVVASKVIDALSDENEEDE